MNIDLNKLTILVNPGHAPNTPGKCSPDKSLYEWEWNLLTAQLTVRSLICSGFKAELVRAMDEKVSLTGPVSHANKLCSKIGKENVLFVSIHCDAAAGPGWHHAKGWSIWTSVGETASDQLATCIYHAAEQVMPGRTLRKQMSDGDVDYEKNYYVLYKTNCPAVLIENGFMNDREECEWLKSDESKALAAETIVTGIENYIKTLSK